MIIKELRKKKRWSAEELATKVGVTSSSIYSWEKGIIPSDAMIEKLAEVFGVTETEITSSYTMPENSNNSSMVASLNAQYDMAMKVIQDEIAFLHKQLQNKEELIMSQSKTISTLAEALGKLGGKPLKPHQMAKYISLLKDESFTLVA